MDEEQYIYNDEQTFDLNNMFLETPALPADKRLVLEEVSVRIIMNSVLAERGIGTYAVITTIANGQESTYDFPFTNISPEWVYNEGKGLHIRTFIASYPVKLYADAGSIIKIGVSIEESEGRYARMRYINATIKISLSGVLIKI